MCKWNTWRGGTREKEREERGRENEEEELREGKRRKIEKE